MLPISAYRALLSPSNDDKRGKTKLIMLLAGNKMKKKKKNKRQLCNVCYH